MPAAGAVASLQGRLLHITLTDVDVKVAPREEADWEEVTVFAVLAPLSALQAALVPRTPANMRPGLVSRVIKSAKIMPPPQGPAGNRAAASEQAQLSSLEAQHLSKSGSSGGGDGGSGSASSGWGLWSLACRVVLNRLQLTITQVHLCFQVPRIDMKQSVPAVSI